jgi:hypothetical protein
MAEVFYGFRKANSVIVSDIRLATEYFFRNLSNTFLMILSFEQLNPILKS